jgi:hypothetical protein
MTVNIRGKKISSETSACNGNNIKYDAGNKAGVHWIQSLSNKYPKAEFLEFDCGLLHSIKTIHLLTS